MNLPKWWGDLLRINVDVIGCCIYMQESSSGKSAFREKPLQVLLKAAESEDNSSLQLLSSSILANIGGTFSWTGEPYTVAWLVKRAGLSSFCLQNLIKDFDWLDHSLQVRHT